MADNDTKTPDNPQKPPTETGVSQQPARRPLKAPRLLTTVERELLRARLLKKFH